MSRRCLILMLALFACLGEGCAVLPPNNVQLLTKERTPPFRQMVHFSRGAVIDQGETSVVMLVSPSAALLIDVRGAANRFQLMLQEGPQYVLYDRIGQRGESLKYAELHPQGLALKVGGDELRGSIDVYVTRGDCDPYDPYFERYPRVLRVIGYVAVPKLGDAADGAAVVRDLVMPPLPVSATATAPSGGVKNSDGDEPWTLRPGPRFEHAIPFLPALPMIDLKVLVSLW